MKANELISLFLEVDGMILMAVSLRRLGMSVSQLLYFSERRVPGWLMRLLLAIRHFIVFSPFLVGLLLVCCATDVAELLEIGDMGIIQPPIIPRKELVTVFVMGLGCALVLIFTNKAYLPVAKLMHHYFIWFRRVIDHEYMHGDENRHAPVDQILALAIDGGCIMLGFILLLFPDAVLHIFARGADLV